MEQNNLLIILIFIFGTLFTVIGFLCVFILNSLKNDIIQLYGKVDDHEKRIVRIETEHDTCSNL